MEDILYKNHWEKIYQDKNTTEMTWFQDIPEISLDIIKKCNLKKDATIIDIGGGDSKLIDFLLVDGYTNIHVLDISENAISKAKKRLGSNAEKVTWIISNVLDFKPTIKFDLWHDRATFHFLTREDQIQAYLKLVDNAIIPQGYLTIATFSEEGPDKCSGIAIKKYSESQITQVFLENFKRDYCFKRDHITPLNKKQNFIFVCFMKN